MFGRRTNAPEPTPEDPAAVEEEILEAHGAGARYTRKRDGFFAALLGIDLLSGHGFWGERDLLSWLWWRK